VIVLASNAGVHGGQSIVSVADPEIDQLYDAIVTVPRPLEFTPRPRAYVPLQRWCRACNIAIVAIGLITYAAAFAVYFIDLLTHNFVPQGNYLLLVQVTMQMLVYVVASYAIRECLRRVDLWQCQKPLLTIFKSGIVLDGQFVSWKNIQSCRWNRYVPETLVIAVEAGRSHWRHAVSIPKSHGVLVENTFRRFGKWDQPGAVDEVAFEAGTSLNLVV
jgi:hypothetical protein